MEEVLRIAPAQTDPGLIAYAPRAGGVHDSHHRTAGIAGRTRRRGCVAVRGKRAAASGENPPWCGADRGAMAGRRLSSTGGVPASAARARLHRGPEYRLRISLLAGQ